MKGFVPTPRNVVDGMVEQLFAGRPPVEDTRILDPGCGTGMFIDGVIRWCLAHGIELPFITGVESDPKHIPTLLEKYKDFSRVKIEHRDFLDGRKTDFDYVIGNPPYVPITQLSGEEKERYRALYV